MIRYQKDPLSIIEKTYGTTTGLYLIDGNKSAAPPSDPEKKYLCFFSEQARSDFQKYSSMANGNYPRKPYVNKNWKKKVA